MPEDTPPKRNRRDFLTGKALRDSVVDSAERLGDAILEELPQGPLAGSTIRMATRAMACEFGIALNPDQRHNVMNASDALEYVHQYEQQLTVYRDDSEMTLLNQSANEKPSPAEPNLFHLLKRSAKLAEQTEGAFDPTSGPLIALWQTARQENRLPAQEEIDNVLTSVGMHHVHFEDESLTISYDHPETELNLGGIGKGYALDEIAQHLPAYRIHDYLLHGGQSTMLARGDHNEQKGWPVGIRNPLFTQQLLGTLLLKDQALSSSGSNVQFYRHQGKRYGHILDPRNGWPVDHLLSAYVLAPTAEMADALSTAFFVLGVEKSSDFCHNWPEISAILIPPPRSGRKIDPVLCNIPDDQFFITPPNLPSSDITSPDV